MNLSRLSFPGAVVLLFISALAVTSSSTARSKGSLPTNLTVKNVRDHKIASVFAPVFYQGIGDNPRSDYITNFDFDGDWRGDNNWRNTELQRFPLKAYVYYSVAETATHFFIHYAVFHPRDYKGGERRGAILSELIREGAKRGGKYDPTGLAEETALAHENDMEGCLVVVAKSDGADEGRVVYVETLAHNLFEKYAVSETSGDFPSFRLAGQSVLLYIEPKGHGIHALSADEKELAKKRVVIYSLADRAGNPESKNGKTIGYELLPLETTIWPRAQPADPKLKTAVLAADAMFGARKDYEIVIKLKSSDATVSERKFALGSIGSAFLGKVGGINMGRPPWGWLARQGPEEQRGLWFFDPAVVVKRDFQLADSFSTGYVRVPFWAAK